MNKLLILLIIASFLASCAPALECVDNCDPVPAETWIITKQNGDTREWHGRCDWVSTKECGLYIVCKAEDGRYFRGVVESLEELP